MNRTQQKTFFLHCFEDYNLYLRLCRSEVKQITQPQYHFTPQMTCTIYKHVHYHTPFQKGCLLSLPMSHINNHNTVDQVDLSPCYHYCTHCTSLQLHTFGCLSIQVNCLGYIINKHGNDFFGSSDYHVTGC